MENLFDNNPLVDDLESWLANATATTKTQFCENCEKLTKTIKSRESALKKVKSRIIATDKIIKQYQLKKKLGQTQQQLAFVTEKLKKSEKCSQTLQSKLTGLLNADLLKDAKKDFEQRLAVKDLTIKELEEQLQFTAGEQKIFRDSSAVSLSQIEQLRDENRQQAKVIQSLEANQKKRIQQLERTKKEMDECKSCLAQMKKLRKSLEKEVSHLKEKNDKFVKILLDNGLLPKKELMAMNRKKNMQLSSAEEVSEVGIMSDDDGDDERIEEKKDVKPSLTIDINTIFEEFRAFPQMLSPLPADKESEHDSSMDGSEKSDNDLAKLLELEFLGTSELPEENAEETQTIAEPVNSQNKSDLPTVSPASSSTNAVSKSNADDKSLLEAPLEQSASNMLKPVPVDHSSSTEIELVSVGNLSDTDEENFEPPQKSMPLTVLPKKTSSSGEKFLSNLSSDSDSDDEELKTSSKSTSSSCVTMTKESPYRKPDPSMNCTLKNLQPESPKLCNSPPSLTSEESKEQSIKVVPVRTIVSEKQDHGTDHSFDPFKSNVKMANTLNPTHTTNTTSVGKELTLRSDMKLTQLDMIDLFGSEYLSSSSDDDDDMNSTGNEPHILSVETNNQNRTVEITVSTEANNQNPTTITNITPKTISFEKSAKNSSIEGQFSEDIPSLNKETSENLLASKQLFLPVEQNMAANKILGDSNISSDILLKIHETDLKNTSEKVPCSEQLWRNSNESLRHDLSSSLEMVTCADRKEIDETILKEFNSSDVSAVDADIYSCPGNTSSLLKSLQSTKPKIITDSPGKEYVTNNLKENEESVVDQNRQSDIVVDKTIQLENVDICNKMPEPDTVVDKVLEQVTMVEKTPGPATMIEKMSEPETKVEKTPEAVIVAEKTPEPTTVVEKTPEPAAVVEKTPEPVAVVEKTPEPAAVVEKTPEPATVVEKTPEPVTVVEKTPEPAAVVEKTPEPAAVVEKTPEPAAVVEKTPEPAAVVEKTPEPAAVVEKTPEPAAVVEKTPEPAAVVEKTPEPASVIEKTPEPATVVEKMFEPATVVEKIPQPATVVEKTPEPATMVEKTPEPATVVEKTPEPATMVEKTPEPATVVEKMLEPTTVVEKTPESVFVAEKMPEPATVVEKTPEAAAVVEKTPQAESVDEKAPQAESVDEKAPQTEPVEEKAPQTEPVEEKAPQAEPVDEKAPQAEPVDEKAPEAEPVDEKAPEAEPVDEKAPEAEPVDEKAPEAEPVDEKAPEAEPVDEKAPEAEPVDEKAPEAEPVDEKAPEAELVDDKTFKLESIIVEKSIKPKSLLVDVRDGPKSALEKLIQPLSAEKSVGLESVVIKKPLELESALVVEKPLEQEAVIVEKPLEQEAIAVEKPLVLDADVGKKMLEPEAAVEEMNQAVTQEHLQTENREEMKNSATKTENGSPFLVLLSEEFSSTLDNSENIVVLDTSARNHEVSPKKVFQIIPPSSVVVPVKKTQLQIAEPVSQNSDSCSHFLDGSLQTSIVSSQSQILNRVGADKSVDGPKTLKKQDKVTLSVENNSLAKKTKVLTETDINKVDPVQLSSFQSTCNENRSRDWDKMFSATDILLNHETMNSSLSSDKENEMMNISDRSIANTTDPMKLNKADTVQKQACENPYFLQSKSADMQDSQNIRNDKNPNNSQSSFENSKENGKEFKDSAVLSENGNSESLQTVTKEKNKELESSIGLVNDTENIPKGIGNDSMKENTQTIHNFNKILQNVEISEISKTEIGEIDAKCNGIEILSNNLENDGKQNKLSENLEKPALLKINSVNNVEEFGIDVRLSESSLHIDSENQCLKSRLILESVKENVEENGKEFKDPIVLSATKDQNKELELSLTKVEIISNSDCPKNSIEEIVRNIEDSCGLLEDGENRECLDINSENIPCMSATEKSDHFDVLATREENSNSKVEETSALSRITSGNPYVEDDHDSLNVSGDGFSFEEFSDLEPPELAPVPNSNHVNNVNINELFGDDEDDDDVNQPNVESKETVKVPEEKNQTSSLSNSSLCRMNNTDSCGEGMNETPVPLYVNKIEDEKDLSAVNKTKKQFLVDEFDCRNPRKKRMPVCRMAITPPKRQSKFGREHAVNNNSLGKAKTKDSVIKSVAHSFIKFVASNGKTYLPVELSDTSNHDTLSPSIREETKDSFPADHASKNSDPLPENSLPPSVTDLSKNTECVQPKNHSFSESIFARERSEENNSNEILECIKEFILVTRPISPLPTSPVKSALPPCDHLSPPPKEQTIMQKNVSTPTNSNCDHLKDFQPFLSTISQLSPIITPHKLREKRIKKCLLKDLASEEGSDIASNIAPEPFPKSVAAANTNSTKCQNKRTCHCVLDPDCSSHMPLPKSDTAKPNSTSEVDSSQPSADKTCLNSQQRLLRKTRSLRRIVPPTATSHAKNPRLDSTTKTNKTEQKELPKILPAAQLSSSSSKPKKVDRPMETNPNVVGEELGVPAKEISDPLKLEKVSSSDNSDDGKKRVKSVRKRKLDVTEDSANRDDKKQCLKNDAILSRARASLMKVAGREFQNYWKYVSTSASQVLQKLLQTNREAGLIVEVASKQAVKLLSSTTENMLPWYITQCKSNIMTPYFSDKEKHLLRLLCLFKKRKEMGDIFTTFRNCLKEALTKENLDSTSLGKWSLCRMFLAMCRLEGLLSEARVFFYTNLCQLPCEQYITLAVITACTWPLVLSYERNDRRISLFRVIEYAVLKSINEKPHNMKYLECLVKHCKWKPSGSSKNNDIQRSLFNHLHDCIEEGATKDEIFCYVKGVELLSFQEKWLWTVSLIRSRINNLLKKCLQLEPPEDRHQEFNWLLCYVFQMLGNLCMRSKKRHKIISFVVNSLIKPFLNSNKFSPDVHLHCTQVLMKLYPFEPIVVYPILELWFQETQSSEASSKLRNEWILLKSHLNKETGVT